jgi:hypothetical protein
MDGASDSTPRATLPIACELGPSDGPERLRRWQRLRDTAGPVARLDGRRLEVRYQPRPGVHEELQELAAAEQQCCAFVSWSVQAVDDEPVLHVTAPPETPEAIAPIAALFDVAAAS